MEYLYRLEVPADEWADYQDFIQREIADVGGTVTASGPGVPGSDFTVVVAHPVRQSLEAFVTAWYRRAGWDGDQIAVELQTIEVS